MLLGELGIEAPPDGLPEWLNTPIFQYTDNFEKRFNYSAEGQLLALLRDESEWGPAIQERLGQWVERSPRKTMVREIVRMDGFLTCSAYFSQYRPLTWTLTGPSSCPICKALAGTQSQGWDQPFIQPGQEIDAGEGKTPFRPRRRIHHPEAHKNCDCILL